MMITLDALAERYHVLPSQALATATTLDLTALSIGVAWSRHQQEKAALQARVGLDPSRTKSSTKPELSQEQMLAMMAHSRKQHDKNQARVRR